jgi:hypothetical protein
MSDLVGSDGTDRIAAAQNKTARIRIRAVRGSRRAATLCGAQRPPSVGITGIASAGTLGLLSSCR